MKYLLAILILCSCTKQQLMEVKREIEGGRLHWRWPESGMMIMDAPKIDSTYDEVIMTGFNVDSNESWIHRWWHPISWKNSMEYQYLGELYESDTTPIRTKSSAVNLSTVNGIFMQGENNHIITGTEEIIGGEYTGENVCADTCTNFKFGVGKHTIGDGSSGNFAMQEQTIAITVGSQLPANIYSPSNDTTPSWKQSTEYKYFSQHYEHDPEIKDTIRHRVMSYTFKDGEIFEMRSHDQPDTFIEKGYAVSEGSENYWAFPIVRKQISIMSTKPNKIIMNWNGKDGYVFKSSDFFLPPCNFDYEFEPSIYKGDSIVKVFNQWYRKVLKTFYYFPDKKNKNGIGEKYNLENNEHFALEGAEKRVWMCS